MTRKVAALPPEELEQLNAIRQAEKLAREEEITAHRRNLQRAHHEHMEHLLDGIEDSGIDVVREPIFMQSSRTIGKQLLTYNTRIFTSQNPT